MGLGMASRLAESNLFKVTLYNRTPLESAQKLAQKFSHVKVADSIAEACAETSYVFTSLSDDKAVESVTNEVVKHLKHGAVHVSTSTISPELSRKLAQLHARHHSEYIAAPVFGRPSAASSGNLGIVVSGNAATIENLKPYFNILGKRTFVVGEDVGLANVVKLGGNMMLMSAVESMSECFALTAKAGVDPAVFHEIFSNTLFAGSPVHANYGKMIVEQNFQQENGFKVSLGLKDVRLALKEADSLEVPLPQINQVHDVFVSLIGRGDKESDICSMAKFAFENSGIHKVNK
jgi:3-hydroxyisobutyrate dehydrogenase-like beta-hydroxyacid dehydrogenase